MRQVRILCGCCRYGGIIPAGTSEAAQAAVAELNGRVGPLVQQYVAALEKIKLKEGIRLVMTISAAGNKFFQVYTSPSSYILLIMSKGAMSGMQVAENIFFLQGSLRVMPYLVYLHCGGGLLTLLVAVNIIELGCGLCAGHHTVGDGEGGQGAVRSAGQRMRRPVRAAGCSCGALHALHHPQGDTRFVDRLAICMVFWLSNHTS